MIGREELNQDFLPLLGQINMAQLIFRGMGIAAQDYALNVFRACVRKAYSGALGENYGISYGRGKYLGPNFFANHLGDTIGKDILMVFIQPLVSLWLGITSFIFASTYLLLVAPVIAISTANYFPIKFGMEFFIHALGLLGAAVISPVARIVNIFSRLFGAEPAPVLEQDRMREARQERFAAPFQDNLNPNLNNGAAEDLNRLVGQIGELNQLVRQFEAGFNPLAIKEEPAVAPIARPVLENVNPDLRDPEQVRAARANFFAKPGAAPADQKIEDKDLMPLNLLGLK